MPDPPLDHAMRYLVQNLFLLLLLGLASALEAQPASLSQESERIVEVTLPDGTLLSDALVIHFVSDQWWIPLGQLSDALQIAVAVSPLYRRAEGFILEEIRTFYLDLNRSVVRLSGREMPVPEGKTLFHEDEIYVESSLLESWFPAVFKIDALRSRLTILPKEKLPLQQKIERQQELQRARSQRIKARDFPQVEVPRLWADLPFLDQQFLFTQAKNGESTSQRLQFTSEMSAELLTLDSYAYAYGDQNRVDRYRLRFSRKDPNGDLLGAGLSTVEFFDINLPALPLLTPGITGRGFHVSSYPLNQPDLFSQQTFEGPLPPNWDVELYHNDLLIDRFSADGSGQYVFRNIPVRYGRNQFRLAFYGPQGQRRDEYRTFFVDPSLLKPGRKDFRIGWIKQENQREQLMAQYEQNVGGGFTASAGLLHEAIPRRSYALLGGNALLADALFTGNCAIASDGGKACGLGAQTAVKKVNLGSTYQKYFSFRSDIINSDGGPPVADQLTFSLNSVLPFKRAMGLQTDITAQWREDSSTRLSRRLLLSTNFGPVFLNHALNWDSQTNPEVSGRLNVTVLPFGANLRLGLEWDPVNWLKAVEGEVTYRKENRFSISATVKRLLSDSFTQSHLIVSRLFKAASLGFDIADQGPSGMTFGMLMNFSLSPETHQTRYQLEGTPQAQMGAASILVFVDENNNGLRDDGEPAVSGMHLSAGRLDSPFTTDESGIAWLPRLTPYERTSVSIQLQSLVDPHVQPVEEGISFIPRPGKVARLQLRLIRTAEIDGHVTASDLGRKKGRRSIELELVPETGGPARRVKTDGEGYFLFEKVPVGNYRLRPMEHQLGLQGYQVIPAERKIEIPKNGGFLTEQDFELDR